MWSLILHGSGIFTNIKIYFANLRIDWVLLSSKDWTTVECLVIINSYINKQ